jgi:glucose-6-phosphate-specific signal transduction histidine kinase
MRKEIKALLKDELKAVQSSKISLLTGVVMFILDIALVLTSIISVHSLIVLIPLVFVIRKVYFEYQLNKAMLTLTRTLIDDEFQEK